MEKQTNYFVELNAINVSDKIEYKNGLSYLSWAWAWQQIKSVYPNAQVKVYETPEGCIYWHDMMTAWVKVGVTVNDIEHIEYLPVMDYKNKSIPMGSITSMNVNTAIQRATVKAIARHGLGLYIYAGEDLPEEDKKAPNGALSVTNGTRGGLTKKEFTAKIEAIKTSLNNCNDLDNLKAVWIDAQADLLIIKGLEDGLYYDMLEARKNELKVNFEGLAEILETKGE